MYSSDHSFDFIPVLGGMLGGFISPTIDAELSFVWHTILGALIGYALRLLLDWCFGTKRKT